MQVLIPKLKEPDLNPNVVINIVATMGELVQVRDPILPPPSDPPQPTNPSHPPPPLSSGNILTPYECPVSGQVAREDMRGCVQELCPFS